MENAGADARLSVSSKCLSLVNSETSDYIVKHDMPKISFASGGDSVRITYIL